MARGPLDPLDPRAFTPIDLGPPLAGRVASDLAVLRGADDLLRSAADRLVHAAPPDGGSGLDGLLDELAGAIGIVIDAGAGAELDKIESAAGEYRYALDVKAHFLPPDADAPREHDVPDPDDRFDKGNGTPTPTPPPPPPPDLPPWGVGPRPTIGRFKSDGRGGCDWDARDTGPDQCKTRWN